MAESLSPEPVPPNQTKLCNGSPTVAENPSPPHTDSAKPFRFMALPAELRLMIAEYVVCHDRDLVWYWESDYVTPTKGSFVTKASISNGELDRGALTRLCVSRQLRLETLDLWKKFAILHFNGQCRIPPTHVAQVDRSYASVLDRAVMEYDSFVNLTRAKNMDRIPSVVIEPDGFHCDIWTKLQLHNLRHDQRLSDIRIVDLCSLSSLFMRWRLGLYRTKFQQAVEEVCMSKTKERCYKVFPHPELEKYIKDASFCNLSAEEHDEMMDWVHNGL